ncbi:MAG TPA: HNH endonuclease [Ktedonobacterales bacterium]|nr:HNH endonuclease [Ktedonobacterales bacterium]
MSKAYVPKELRHRIAGQARHRCGYCLTSQKITGMHLDVEHIIPEARGGKTEEDNLWLACSDCNEFKGDRIEATDPLTEEVVRMFDPRHQRWDDHFAWTALGDEIVGLTEIGRATVAALKLNRALLLDARRMWVKVGWHPPKD